MGPTKDEDSGIDKKWRNTKQRVAKKEVCSANRKKT